MNCFDAATAELSFCYSLSAVFPIRLARVTVYPHAQLEDPVCSFGRLYLRPRQAIPRRDLSNILQKPAHLLPAAVAPHAVT
jgi:hypothetical protein